MADLANINYKHHYPANYFDYHDTDLQETVLSLDHQISKSRGEMMMWLSHRLVPMTFSSDPSDKLTIENLNIGILSQDASLFYDQEDDKLKIGLDKTISTQITRLAYSPILPLAFTSIGGEVYRKPTLKQEPSFCEFESTDNLTKHKLFIGNAEVSKQISLADNIVSQSVLSIVLQLKGALH